MYKRIVFTLFCFTLLCGAYAKDNQHKEPLFGKKYQQYTVTSSDLNGAVFYLVSRKNIFTVNKR